MSLKPSLAWFKIEYNSQVSPRLPLCTIYNGSKGRLVLCDYLFQKWEIVQPLPHLIFTGSQRGNTGCPFIQKEETTDYKTIYLDQSPGLISGRPEVLHWGAGHSKAGVLCAIQFRNHTWCLGSKITGTRHKGNYLNVHQRMNGKLKLVRPHNGILFLSRKLWRTDWFCNIDELWEPKVKGKKIVTKNIYGMIPS